MIHIMDQNLSSKMNSQYNCLNRYGIFFTSDVLVFMVTGSSSGHSPTDYGYRLDWTTQIYKSLHRTVLILKLKLQAFMKGR